MLNKSMIINSLRHQEDGFFPYLTSGSQCISLQRLILCMLASHTWNNDLLQDMIVLEFAQVAPLLSQPQAIQHQRHLHLGFNKHLS